MGTKGILRAAKITAETTLLPPFPLTPTRLFRYAITH